MANAGYSASGSVQVTIRPAHEWAEKMAVVKKAGNDAATRMRAAGRKFDVELLAPTEVREQDKVPHSAVFLYPDWRIAIRREMVEPARKLIGQAYTIGSLDPALPTVLSAVIQGKSLYEYGIGEFFELFGEFQGRYELADQEEIRDKMTALVNGDRRYLKNYTRKGKTRLHPLPLAVRNTLAHPENKANTLDREGKELRTSIELLRSWLALEK